MIFIALALVGGKFKLAGKASIVEKQAWNKFLIPNVKTERLRYFNNITRGVYESAYFGKQTGFQAYLDGQRRFRYGIKLKCDALQNIYSSYQEGLIPKQNICWKRCNDFPSDVKVDDASKSQCAVEHFNGTISSLKSLKDQLLSRKKELYNEHMEEKSWAGETAPHGFGRTIRRTYYTCIGALGPHVLISNMNRVPFCVISCKRCLRMRKIAFQRF